MNRNVGRFEQGLGMSRFVDIHIHSFIKPDFLVVLNLNVNKTSTLLDIKFLVNLLTINFFY